MGFIENVLNQQEYSRMVAFPKDFEMMQDKVKFLNSGVGLNHDLKVITLDYENAGQGVETFFQKGKNLMCIN